jgi:hypothetical protein
MSLLKLASTARLATIHELRRWPEEGALMSYGQSLTTRSVAPTFTSTES